MIKERAAVIVPEGITVGGDERAGKKLGEEYAKVMLRAFNGEADASIAKAKYNNMQMLQKRISSSYANINKLGKTMGIAIADQYLHLRIEELKLAYEFERKKQEEREQQAYLRELAREEDRARKEAEKAKREAEKAEVEEKKRLAEKEAMLADLTAAMESTRRNMEKSALASSEEYARLQQQLADQESQISSLETQRDTLIQAVQTAHDRTEKAISLAQLTKRGHVYILSNVGSFGENCFKIGMTRREDPNDRVKELGSASVPFPFDIHAMILTNDAPALERALHQHFVDHRINKVNNRKEFFNVSIDEIEAALEDVHVEPVSLQQIIPEAAEYRETMAIIREGNDGARLPHSPVLQLRSS